MPTPELPPLSAPLSRADYMRLSRELEASQAPALNLAVLASFTADFLRPCLVVEAARRQLGFNIWLAPFGQIEQQIV